jgi:hypothetical protein
MAGQATVQRHRSLAETRRQDRHRKAHDLAAFMNDHKSAFNPGDEKNAQGLMFIWALHQLQETMGSLRGVSLRAIAEFIKVEGMWFKPQIRKEGGQYHGPKPSAECPPYLKDLNGEKQAVMYLPDKTTPRGFNETTQFIMNQIKSVVVTEKRSHDIIRTLVTAGEEKNYYLELPQPSSRLFVRVEVILSDSDEEISDSDEDADEDADEEDAVVFTEPRVSFLPQQSIPRKQSKRSSPPQQSIRREPVAKMSICPGCQKTFTPSGCGLFLACGGCRWEGSVCRPIVS